MPTAADAAPLDAAQFAAALDPLGPFEARPRLAIAVSGGADSLALAILAHAWARRRQGDATALIVDHGLRAGVASEARRVRGWLADRGIQARILAWLGAKPTGDIQAAARAARYALLAAWCARHGVLHLLVGHHRDDQAETLLLNLARGSGVDGLAAMPAVIATHGIRLLRPLLAVPKPNLLATLRALGQPWIEDPSNASPRFRRSAARALTATALAPLAPGEVDAGRLAERLADTAARLARARHALELATADLLAAAVDLSPHGFALLRPEAFRAAPEEIALRGLGRVIACIGGGTVFPRHDALRRALAALDGAGATLGGCRLVHHRDGVLVWRELAAVAPALSLPAGRWVLWDGRFRVRIAQGGCRVAALGDRGIEVATPSVPARARPSLPALFDARGVFAVPGLGYVRGATRAVKVIFQPRRSLAPLALAPPRTMYR